MPLYSFKCTCGYRVETMLPMSESCEPQLCATCGCTMSRDYQADVFHASGRDYHKAIHSDSLAINPDQVAEHKKRFPDVKIDSDCRPVFENFKQHDDYLEKTGFVKHTQKVRKRGRKIKMKSILILMVATIVLSLAGCGSEFLAGGATGAAVVIDAQDRFIEAVNAMNTETARINGTLSAIDGTVLIRPETLAAVESVRDMKKDPVSWVALISLLANAGVVGKAVSDRNKLSDI